MVWAQTPNPGAALQKRMADHPQANLVVAARTFDNPVPAEAGNLDLITIVLNYHDISYLPVDRAKMNQKLYAALKPGGRLVVIDHSAINGTGISAGKTLHRIDEDVVLTEVAGGLVLDTEGGSCAIPDPRRVVEQPKVPTDKFALRS
jgi:predicted methyltransferase